MTNTNTAAETVYAAIELSKKTWVLGIAFPDRDRPSIYRIPGGNVAELVSRLRVAARNNRRILVCYEAGYDGFWLARALAKMGIECRVLDPASIQVNRRARRVKTDRIALTQTQDSRRVGAMRFWGAWHGPSVFFSVTRIACDWLRSSAIATDHRSTFSELGSFYCRPTAY